MAINFPNSPSVNDQYTVGDRTWTWNGTYWQTSTSMSTFTASDSEPVDADAGDIWFDSTIGKTFINYSGTWVEIGNAATVVDVIADADADTKVQVESSADEDKIRFSTAGTERVIVDNTGFVGIGMTPTLPLDVEGRGRFVSPNVGSTGAVIVRQPAGDVDGGYIQWVNNANSAQMGTIYVSNSGSFAISPSSGTINLAGSNLQKNGTTFYGVGYADISFTVSSTTTAAWYMLSMPSGVDIYNMIGFTPLEGLNNTLTVYYWRLGVWSGIQTASQLYLHCALGNSVHTNPYYIRFYYRI